MTTLAEKIAVMQAAERGEKIEFKSPAGGWHPAELCGTLSWNWSDHDYRVAPKKPEYRLAQYTAPTWACDKVVSIYTRNIPGKPNDTTVIAERYVAHGNQVWLTEWLPLPGQE